MIKPDLIPVKIPLINPNEPEARLAALHVVEGQAITAGDVIAVLETTKATSEMAAEQDGFIAGLDYQPGDSVRAGDILCYISAQAETVQTEKRTVPPDGLEPPGLRITQPARSLAVASGLKLTDLPTDILITEDVVRGLIFSSKEYTSEPPVQSFNPTSILIYGAGGHGKALLDLLRTTHVYEITGFIDDGKPVGEWIMGLPVLGGVEKLKELYQQGTHLAVNAVGGIGDLQSRWRVFQRLAEAGYTFPAIVHPSATIEQSASIAPGIQVMPHAYVGSEVNLGFGVIINSAAIISHDCLVGDYANISPGAILAGGVQVGAGCLIGMGVTINLQVKIGDGARIGNGATIKSDVPDGGVIRAGTIWPD